MHNTSIGKFSVLSPSQKKELERQRIERERLKAEQKEKKRRDEEARMKAERKAAAARKAEQERIESEKQAKKTLYKTRIALSIFLLIFSIGFFIHLGNVWCDDAAEYVLYYLFGGMFELCIIFCIGAFINLCVEKINEIK